ncbi:GrpB family protein, partial [Kribbella turkmenica]
VENPDRTKRYFREAPGGRRTHVHVRRTGSFSEQVNLLFRDFLRSHPEHAQKYGELKRGLAAEFPGPKQRGDYVEAKGPFIWRTIQFADEWAQSIGWEPPPSDR